MTTLALVVLVLSAEGGETVVTATRSARTLEDSPVATTVIPRAELERSPTQLTDELLRTSTVVQTFRRSSSLTADPTSQGLSLRGIGPSGVSRAVLLVDGVPMNDGFGGWVYWRALPRLGMARVEIVPGAASAQYGSGALGGVVQVVTRRIGPLAVDADGFVGTQETQHAAGRVASRFATHWGASVEVEALRSVGFPVVAPWVRGPIDREAPSAHLTINGRVERAVGERGVVFLSGGYFGEDQSAGTPLSGSEVRLGHAVLGADLEAGGTWQARLFGRLEHFGQTRSRVSPDRTEERQTAVQSIPIHDEGLSLAWTSRPLGTHVLSAGVDGRSVGALGKAQQAAGVFVQDAWKLVPAFEAVGAVRLDGWRHGERLAGAVSPKVALHWRVHETTSVRAAGYRAFRAPTLNELYRPFQVGTVLTAANEALAPETLWGGDLGVETRVVRGVTLRATGFANVLENPIANVGLPDGTRQRQNLGAARILGLESGVDVRALRRLFVSLAYTLVDARVTAGDPALVGKQLAQDPAHRFTAGVSFVEPKWFTLMVQVRVLSAAYEDDRNTLELPPSVMIDAALSRQLGKGIELFVASQNLLGSTAVVGRAGIDTVAPPFSLRAGLRLRL